VINIILDYTFILVFHTGVEGAAWATIIAQLVSGILCLPVIAVRLPVLLITKADWRFTAGELWDHIRVALPMGFQMSIIALGSVTVTFALNRLGAIAVAAFTASQKIDMLVNMPLNSFGAAMATYAAQNYGARKLDRIKTGVKSTLIMALSFSLIIGLIYFFFGRFFSSLFLGNEEEAVTLSHRYLKIAGLSYVFLGVLFILRQTLQGLGNSIIPTLAGGMELVMRTFAAIILSQFFGFTGLCFSSPLAWVASCITLIIAAAIVFKDLNRKLRGGYYGKTESYVT
jgi:Na+-driven multidrug efflux pump